MLCLVFFYFLRCVHLTLQKCCVFCFAKNKDAEHFPLENVRVAEHFPLENVRQNAFCRFLTFCLQNVRKRQNAFDAALTFCLQNVRKRFAKEMYANRALQKSISAQHLPFCVAVSSTIALQKGIFASGHFFSNNLAHFC